MNMEMSMEMIAVRQPEEIRSAFTAARKEHKLRHREAARLLGLTEAQALAAFVGHHVLALRPEFPAIMARIRELGEVLALTRNEAAVHEKVGHYKSLTEFDSIGLMVGKEIDLRMFFAQWAHAFAVSEEDAQGVKRSLQFFDRGGDAVHKIFLRAESDLAAWERLVADFRSPLQAQVLELGANEASAGMKADSEVDQAGFRAAWEALEDTHEFFGMLRRFGVSRTQAMRLAPPRRTRRVGNDAARRMLQAAAVSGVPIMAFVGSRGMIQIHSGAVHRIVPLDGESARWINVMDERFNLHLDEAQVAEAWIVSKPTADGDINSLELFDADGETIVLFFGQRKPGHPELPAWRELLDGVLPEAL